MGRCALAADGTRVDALDGLRGLAALWVVAGHSLNLSGAWIPIIGRPLLAVDLFMMLSGALMVYQSDRREAHEPMSSAVTWLRFWARRFFRIAPLYYLVLLTAMAFGPALGDLREAIADSNGIGTEMVRYDDQSAANIFMHASFVFGFMPAYAERTPLPDWSIGLEMQFYLLFPLFILIAQRVGLWWASIGLTIADMVVGLVAWDFVASFPQPTLLVLKLPVFLAGMLLARARATSDARMVVLAVLLAALPVGPMGHWSETVVRVAMAGMLALVLVPGAPAFELVARPMRYVFSRPISSWLGEVSYGVYLIHLPILVVAVAYVSNSGFGPMARAAMALAIALPVSIGLAIIGYRFVEIPGIALGRSLLAERGERRGGNAPPMT